MVALTGDTSGCNQTIYVYFEMDYGRIERRIIAQLTDQLHSGNIRGTFGFTNTTGRHPYNNIPNLQITEINEKMFERDRDLSYDWFRDFEPRKQWREQPKNLMLCASIRRGQARADIGQSRRHKRKKYLQSLRSQT